MKNYINSILIILIITDFCSSQIIISDSTVWSEDQILTQSVLIEESGVLTITEGIFVQVLFIDTDADSIGDIKIEVEGSLEIFGSIDQPVIILPYEDSNYNRYWSGIQVLPQANSNINHVNTGYAYIPFDLSGYSILNGVDITNPYYTGLWIRNSFSDTTMIYDVEITDSQNHGIIIDSSFVDFKWITINQSGTDGINSNNSEMNLENIVCKNSTEYGFFNIESNLTMQNCLIDSNNRFGAYNMATTLNLKYIDIINNGWGGILIGGDSYADIDSITIKDNVGSGIEISDRISIDRDTSWFDGNSPEIAFNYSNLINNHLTDTLINSDRLNLEIPRHGHCHCDGENAVTSNVAEPYELFFGDSLEIPFGRLNAGTISYYYHYSYRNVYALYDHFNNEYLWYDSTDCGNENDGYFCVCADTTFLDGSDLVGFGVNQFLCNGEDEGNSNSGSIEAEFVPFQVGLIEVQNSVDEYISYNFNGNYWNAITNISNLIYNSRYPNIDYSGYSVNEFSESHSKISLDQAITINFPYNSSSIETGTIIPFNWETNGFIPQVTLFVSFDLGQTWQVIVSDTLNQEFISYFNSFEEGTTLYFKIENSYVTSIQDIIGPIFIIENSTPIINLTPDNLVFENDSIEQSFFIQNIGGGVLEWNLTPSDTWLSAIPLSGATEDFDSVFVSVDWTGITPGQHNGQVFVESNGGNDEINVTMNVPAPSLIIDPISLDFDSTQTEQEIIFFNEGGGSISWSAFSNSSWLTINPESGDFIDEDEAIVQVNREGVAAGIYSGNIIINSSAGNLSISVSMQALNIPPIAVNQSLTTNEDESLNITLTATDYNEDELSYVIVTYPSNGDIDGTLPDLIYIPNENYYGTDSLSFRVSDGDSNPDTGSVSITIISINDSPETISLISPENESTIQLTNDTLGDSLLFACTESFDIDGDILTYGFNISTELSAIIEDSTNTPSYWVELSEFVDVLDTLTILYASWTVFVTDGIDTLTAENAPFVITVDGSQLSITSLDLIPDNFVLYPNHPNPFNPVTSIKYDLPEDSFVELKIIDINGRLVKSLTKTYLHAGRYNDYWNGQNENGVSMSSGIYFITILANDFHSTRKIMLLK